MVATQDVEQGTALLFQCRAAALPEGLFDVGIAHHGMTDGAHQTAFLAQFDQEKRCRRRRALCQITVPHLGFDEVDGSGEDRHDNDQRQAKGSHEGGLDTLGLRRGGLTVHAHDSKFEWGWQPNF